MARTRFKANLAGFGSLRSHPTLVGAMESAARSAAAGTPFEVEVWAHQGRKTGPRTSVQIWARSPAATRALQADTGALIAVLARTGIPFTAKEIYRRKDGTLRTATRAQIDNWSGGRQ